jgi:protein TorT
MVEQGRISMIQAVNYLNSQPFDKTFSPNIETLTPNNIDQQAVFQSLSPSEFRPKFCTKK